MSAEPATNEAAGPVPNGSGPSELKTLIADIEAALARAGHIGDVEVTNLRGLLRDKLAQARAGLSAGGSKVSAAARSAAGSTNEYVHDSPWQSIGIAVLAGAVLGFMVGRRQ